MQPLDFQEKFYKSNKRFPAMISAIGTGKTLWLLLKIIKFCEDYSDSLALIVRKEFTDLRDSTMKDFTRYTNETIDSNKEYHFPNGSTIMFRHGDELNILKNINLSIAGIEQAEEFETDETFQMLRDRLRRDNAPLQQCCIIANACGHNWIWKDWINNPPSEEYDAITAKTFDNPHLPAPFLKDLARMKTEAPNHYRQYVENSFEEIDADDRIFTMSLIRDSLAIDMNRIGVNKRIMGVDIARFGGDEIVYSILESRGPIMWEQVHQECYKLKGLNETLGKIISMQKEFELDAVAIDDDGMGGGITDMLEPQNFEVFPFTANAKSDDEKHLNRRAYAYFKLRDWMEKGWLKIKGDMELHEQLLALCYSFRKEGLRYVVSKDDMRKEGFKSPDRADALMMAVYFADQLMGSKFSDNNSYAVMDRDVDTIGRVRQAVMD